ncbi:FUSC family protein [Vibrio fluminensis]|uniref:FUSC family protein n=1 Tax=Vibrio fluminensis TaxID=2783614 RepID=UPI001887B212|nr:FUSC family protein [Vibrio fluminensis]
MMVALRYRLPLKVALALTLAIVSALWLGWEKPYWAAFSVVVMAVTESTGHSLKKGRQRIVGTLFGVLVAFVMIGLYAQQPIELLACYSLFAALCVYHQTNPRNGYAWSIAMMVATLVMVMGGFSGTQTFNVAVLRIQETILGVVCFSLVFSLLWPASSRTLLLQTLQSYFDQQAALVAEIISDLEQTGHLRRDYSLGNSIKRLSRLEDLIHAAMADSYELSSAEQKWQQLLKQQNQWTLLCGHLYEATRLVDKPFSQTQQDEIKRVLDHLLLRAQRASTLLQTRLAQDSWLECEPLAEKLDNPVAASINLQPQPDDAGHSHGALRAMEKILNQMDAYHHKMHATLLEALGFTHHSLATEQEEKTQFQANLSAQKRPWLSIDPERAINALKVSIMLWISMALWLYVPTPGGPMIVLFGGAFGAVVLSMPFASTRSLLFYMLGWAGVVLLQYIFILPHFSEIWQLGGFYFINSFVIWFVFNQPQQIFHRLLGTMNLVLMTNSAMQLTPTYDIQYSLLVLMLFTFGMLVIFFVNHGVFSANPERVFLRQLGHFRRSLQANLQSLLTSQRQPWVTFVSPVAVKAVAGAEAAINVINWQMYPELDKAEAEQLIARAYSLCLHYRAFADSYRQWQQSSFHAGIDRLIQRSIAEMTKLLDTSMISEDNRHHAIVLRQLQQQLQHYLYGFEGSSPLQIAFSQPQADQSYQLLVSMQILVESLQQLQQDTSVKDFYQLRLSPFTI